MSRSTYQQEGSSFAYHAQAIGFAATLHKPSNEIIPGQASVSLSQAGGESYSEVHDFDWRGGIIHFDTASSYVTGSYDPEEGEFNTLATVTVRGLNIANMITADHLIARVSTRHKRDSHRNFGEGSLHLVGSSFSGLRVGGVALDAPLDFSHIDGEKTFEQLQVAFPPPPPQQSQGSAPDPPPNSEEAPRPKPKMMSMVLGPWSCGRFQLDYHGGIVIPEFGTIYLATVIIKPGYRRISMLRAELGSPIGGTVEVCGGEGNGGDIWG
jgi:hypothetical protein